MHSKSYNINVACFCSEDFTKSLEELKPFFGFNLVTNDITTNDLISNKFNALIIESELKKKILLDNISVPKILIQKNKKLEKSKELFQLIINLPLHVIRFNQDVIDVCKSMNLIRTL